MPGVAGVETKAAFKKATTWGTAVACGANDGILILPPSIRRDASVEIDDSLGTYFALDGNPGQVKDEGQLPMYLRYDGLDVLVAQFLGVAGAPAQQGGTPAYAYAYKWSQNNDGKFGTLALNLKNYVEEHSTAKIVGMTIKGEVGKPLQIVFDVIGINKITGSATNTTVTFANVTFPETSNRVLFAQGVFRINDQSGIALADSDKIYPSSFELVAKRKQAGAYTGQYRTAAPNVQDLIDEPSNDGMPEISLKLQLPRHAGNTNLLALASDTRKKMDITFTGGLISGAYYRQLKLQFPHLQPRNADVTIENGQIKEPLEYLVHAASAAPTGMTNITDPFWLTGINKRTSDPLA